MVANGKYHWYKDWLLLVSPVTISILYAIQYVTREQPLLYAQIFPTWFIMYYAGCLYRHGVIKCTALSSLSCVLLSIYLTHIESTYINDVIGVPFWAASQIKFSSFLFSLSLCFLFMSLHCQVNRGAIVRLGEYSFGIFLLHLPVKIGIEKAVNYIIPMSHPLWQLSVVILTLAACWILIEISNRLLPQKINIYLGLR